jgi:Ner family transcriptional regulator
MDAPKRPAQTDWHKADIVAALWKRGTSLQRLARINGYAHGSINFALHRPWPKAERIIAGALGLQPQNIWPSRYNENGTPRSGRGDRGLGRHKSKHSAATTGRNVKLRKAA